MSNILKCPFCQQELEEDYLDVKLFGCENQNCKYSTHYDTVGTKNLWQELIRTRKALYVATGFIKGISQTVINDCDNQYVVLGNFKKSAQDTLDQIKTALEQKD